MQNTGTDTMMKLVQTRFLLIFLVFLLILPVHISAQQLKEMQFTNQPITDILLALAEISGKSIIPDETVKGNASYYFSDTDFETAFQIFLKTYKLFHWKENDIYYVSRIRTEYDTIKDTISLDAEDVDIPLIVKAASKAINKTILFDPLPSQPITIHVSAIKPEKLLNIIIKRYPDYQIETDQDYFYIKHAPVKKETAGTEKRGPAIGIQKDGDLFSIDLQKERFQEIIDELFLKAGREFSLLMRKDTVIDNLRFENKDFEQILRLILEQANADFTRVGNIYYIFEIQQKDILKKLKSTIRIPLAFLSAKDLTNLFPSDLLSSNLYKLDLVSNAIILSGSLEEIGPVQDFIKKVDRPIENQQYFRFDLSYLESRNIKSLLPLSLKFVEPILIPDSNSFVALLPPANKEILEDYLKLIDKPPGAAVVELKYISANDLLKYLPPSISKEEIILTNDPSIVFVRTSEKKIEDFYRELDILDRPIPQIRYQFLVIQYSEGQAINWSDSLEASQVESGAQTALLGTIGQLLSLNFDIVSTFGYQFALKLNLDLSTNNARVLADTTLIGLSGQKISFQNTETFRYREIEVDEEGKVKYTGVSREITSGLIFDITGWASGDEMITMDVKATVSKRGTDMSGTTGSLPPTSENVVNTHVRTFSGAPVIIGGLIRQEKDSQVSKFPVLAEIPLVGLLFQSRKETFKNTELAIYIVPHVDYTEFEESNTNLRMERIYKQFVKRETYE